MNAQQPDELDEFDKAADLLNYKVGSGERLDFLVVPGLDLVATLYGCTIQGNVGNTVLPTRINPRRVKQVRSNDCIFLTPEGKESYLQWPKATDIVFPDDNTAVISMNGKPCVTYVFPALVTMAKVAPTI